MLTKRESYLSNLMIFFQILLSMGIFIVPILLLDIKIFNFREQLFFLIQIFLIWSLLFNRFHLGIIFRVASMKNMLHGYFMTVFLAATLFLTELDVFKPSGNVSYARLYIIIFCISDVVLLIGFKFLFYTVMRAVRRKGYNTRRAVIIADENSIPFLRSFIKSKDWGYRLVAIYTMYEELKGKYPKVRIVKSTDNLKRFILNNPVDDLFYCVSLNNMSLKPQEFIEFSETIGINFHMMLPEYYSQMSKGEFIDFIKAFRSYHTVSSRYFSLKIKELLDIVVSGFILLAITPLMCLIAILIKMEDGGAVFFKQERIGLNGRRFNCLKFRSMVVDAEALRPALLSFNESDGPTFKMEHDPRVTKIGRLLRKTSLDELPQFINVIKNEMAIIGPRPPLLSEVQQYEKSQIRRLSMKPGISCIWQVWGRNQVSFQEWMRMDLEYIDNWSLILDIKIFLATIVVVFKGTGK